MIEETNTDEQGTQEGQSSSQAGDSEIQEIGKDVDLSKLPEEAKKQVEEIRKQFQKDYTRKTMSLAELRKETEERKSAYEKAASEAKETRDLADKHGLTIKDVKTESQRLIDKLKASADPETEKNLRNLETIIHEITDIEAVRKTVEALQTEVNRLSTFALKNVDRDYQESLKAFKDEGGDNLFKKYGNQLLELHRQYPQLTAFQIFENVAPQEDKKLYWSHILDKDKKTEVEKKRHAVSSSGETVVTGESDYAKDSKGRLDLGKTMENIVGRLKRNPAI